MTREELEIVLRARQEGMAAFAATEKEMKELASEAKRTSEATSQLSERAGRLADSVGRTATTMARAADLFGLPVGPLRAIDDAADIAELGLKNLASSQVGFNTATLGTVGAGLALGSMLGGLLRQIPAVAAAADGAAASFHRWLTGMDPAKLAAGPAGFDPKKIAAANVEAVERQIESLRAAGSSIDDIARSSGTALKQILAPLTEGQQLERLKELGFTTAEIIKLFPDLADNLKGETDAQKAAAEATKQHEQALRQLRDSISGADLQKQAAELAEALSSGIDLTDTGSLDRAHEKIQTLIEGGLSQLPPALEAVEDAWYAANQAGRDGIDVFEEAAQEAIATNQAIADRSAREIEVAYDEQVDAVRRQREEWKRVQAELEAARFKAEDLLDTIEGVSQLAAAFGFEGVSAGLQSAVGLMDQFDQAAQDGLISWGEMASLAASTVAAFKQATDSASAAQRAMGGAMTGAAAGGKIGSFFGPVGAAIGAGAGGIIGAVAGIFRKPEWVKVGKEAGQVLGVGISKELAEQIAKDAKDLGISIKDAALLSLSEAMDESGDSAVDFADQMSALLQGIASGSIPATEGVEELGEAYSQLIEEAEAGSTAAMASMGQLAAQARQLGQDVPAITEQVKQDVAASMAETGRLGGIKVVDAASAKAQAQIFLNVFQSTLATEGIVAAAQGIQPAIKTLEEQLKEAGIGKGAADSILGPVRAGMSLLKNDLTRGGAEGAQALKTILESQLKAGFLDTATFGAIQQQAKTAFDQMIKGGADTNAAFQAAAPLLAQLQQTAIATGQALDPVTQGLIDQAKSAGVAFPTDTGQQMVTLLGQVVELLGGIPATFAAVGQAGSTALGSQIPDAAGAAGQAITDTLGGSAEAAQQQIEAATAQIRSEFLALGNVPVQTNWADNIQGDLSKIIDLAALARTGIGGIGGLGGGGIGFEGPFPHQFAGGSGGIRDFGQGQPAMLHGKEGVFTERQLGTMLSAAAEAGARAGGGGSGVQVIQVVLDGQVLGEAVAGGHRGNRGGQRDAVKRNFR